MYFEKKRQRNLLFRNSLNFSLFGQNILFSIDNRYLDKITILIAIFMMKIVIGTDAAIVWRFVPEMECCDYWKTDRIIN